MPYSPAFEPNISVANHSTAKQFPASIQEYLQTEIAHRAIMGPYSNPPVGGLHCSPMLTRPKTGSDSRKVIVDLSWPHGKSVNDLVCQDTYMGNQQQPVTLIQRALLTTLTSYWMKVLIRAICCGGDTLTSIWE